MTTDRALQNRALFGVLLMIGGLALYPISDAFIKDLMKTYTVHQATFLRSVTRLVPLLIAMYFQGGARHILKTQQPLQHIIRLAVSLSYTYLFMKAFKMSSLTLIYTLAYTSPFFMILLSAIILKEKVSLERWAAVAIGMIGVVIAMRPESGKFDDACTLVLIGTFLGALNKILMRKLAATEHSLAIAIYPNVAMILITAGLLVWKNDWLPMPWKHWGLFAIVGVITATGQYAIAQALRFAQASKLAPIDYSTFFWVIALDYIFLNHIIPETHTLIGAAIIVSSNLYILYRTRHEEVKKTAPAN